MRRGFPGAGRPLGGTYGDPLMRGNAKDGYGIVPMPGIEKINVRTKSAYGSLREGKVNFVCHNLRQLAVLELLYMRPGYPVLLEWCYDPYIIPGEEGSKRFQVAKPYEIASHYISNNEDFFLGNMKNTYISAEITRQRKLSFGNYDAILGLCKNFSYSARPDGGFNCTTELMAVGESLNTIKGRDISIKHLSSVTNNNNDTSTIEKVLQQPYILDFLEKTHDYVYQQGVTDNTANNARRSITEGPDDKLDTDDDEIVVGKNFNRSAAYHTETQRRGNFWITFYKDRLNTYNIPYAEMKRLYEHQYINQATTGGTYMESWYMMHFTENRPYWKEAALSMLNNTYVRGALIGMSGLGLIGAMWLLGSSSDARAVGEGYIRLDALCYIINRYCMIKFGNEKGGRLNYIQCLNYRPNFGGTKKALVPNQFAKYSKNLNKIIKNQAGVDFDAKIVDCSQDPYVCLMPEQLKDQFADYWYSDAYILPFPDSFGFPDGPSGEDFYNQYARCFGHSGDTEKIKNSKKIAKQSIGQIQVNLRYLLKCHDAIYEEGTTNDNYSIGSFLTKVLEGINNCMANGLKLSLVSDNEFPSITQIVDLNHEPQTDYHDIFEFNVLSNDTVVRNFSFNSAVPSAMSSTIAIGAGDPDNVSNLDGVTFASMNRGIRNRLVQPPDFGKTEGLSQDEKDKIFKQYNEEIQEIIKLGRTITEFQINIQSGVIFHNTKQNKSDISSAKSNLGRLQALANIVAAKDYKTGEQRKIGYDGRISNPPNSTPIPIKIDMTLDGIGGLVIGQMFRVNESRLPLQYRNKNIIFIVVSEEQNIDNKGQWTTKISGQMQLFPDESETIPMSQATRDLLNFDAHKYCRLLRDALHQVDDDEEAIERIFFDLGLSTLELRKIQGTFNSSTTYTDTWNRSILLHVWLEDDYRYSDKSEDISSRGDWRTGNDLCEEMYRILGHEDKIPTGGF